MTLFFVIVGCILIITLMPVFLTMIPALIEILGGLILIGVVAIVSAFMVLDYVTSWLWRRLSRNMPILLGVGTLLLITLLAYLSKTLGKP